VYKAGGSLDDVIGFFYVKDLLRWLAGDGPKAGGAAGGATAAVSGGASGGASGGGVRMGGFDLKAILRPALHVPESKTIRECANEFVAKKVHAAVVVDEYGAVMGLVTMEDIVEEVFGDIQDEYERVEDAPRIEVKLDEDGRGGLADIDARAYVPDANEALEPLGVELPESDDYDTVGGFVLWTLGHMPEVNETFTHGRMQVTVLESTPTRVLRVRVHVQPPAVEAGTAEGAGGGMEMGEKAK
jgi:CBS domain containing-hemolysin-like protein